MDEIKQPIRFFPVKGGGVWHEFPHESSKNLISFDLVITCNCNNTMADKYIEWLKIEKTLDGPWTVEKNREIMDKLKLNRMCCGTQILEYIRYKKGI